MKYNLEIDESTNLLEDGLGARPRTTEERKSNVQYVQIAILLTAVLAVVFLISGNISGKPVIYAQENAINPSGSSDVVFTVDIAVKNPLYGDEPTVLEYLPWDAIAEPYKLNEASVSTLELNGVSLTAAEKQTLSFEWVINGKSYYNETAMIRIDATGVFDSTLTITLTETIGAATAGTSYTYDFTLASKYVRREVRSMADAERVNYFRVLKLLYTTDENLGKTLYGDKFHTSEYFLYKHLTGAGTSDCDHWHDGPGILTHHAAISLEFEQALQSIDPSVAGAYWEYGKEAYLYDNLSESPIFLADWFGEANPSNDEHIILDGGIWQGVELPSGEKYKTMSVSKSLNPYVNAHGVLRSPWNNNPATEIGRSNYTYGMSLYQSAPSCECLFNCYESSTLSSMLNQMNGATHGPVHIMIGGAWNAGDIFDNDVTSVLQDPNKLLLFKVIWRYGWTRCPISCETTDDCKCSVPDEYINTYGAKTILNSSQILSAYSMDDSSEEDCLLFLRAIEDPGYVGEMYSSAATFDPTFWPLHGSIERIANLKRSQVSLGIETNFDETWDYPTYSTAMMSAGAYLDGQCDWSNVKDASDLTLPTCTMGNWCSGHYENDTLEFSNFLGNDETYTNAEMYEFIHPWNDDLPYTYDTFDFDYCIDEGYVFEPTDSNGKPVKTKTGKYTFGSPMRRV